MNSIDTTNLILLLSLCSTIIVCGCFNIIYALYRNTSQTNEQNNSLLNDTV
jgi:hypothetical protein